MRQFAMTTPASSLVTRMRTRSVSGLLAAALLVLSACTIRPGMNPVVDQEALTPPRPISGGGPALVGATPQAPIALEILVQIDTLGRADLSTLKVTGQGVEPNLGIITDWLRTARFEPARLNGYLVRGWFNVLAEAKAAGAR
jgi:hypothetical protein